MTAAHKSSPLLKDDVNNYDFKICNIPELCIINNYSVKKGRVEFEIIARRVLW